MNNGLSQFIAQLLTQAPLLIAFLVGLILALLNWNRVPGPARMTCLAVVLLVALTFEQIWVQEYVVRNSSSSGTTGMQIAQTLRVIALVNNSLRAGAYGLLIAAVFMGRVAPTDQRGFQVMPGAPTWPPPPPQMPPRGPRA
jgi:hypothetical protein